MKITNNLCMHTLLICTLFALAGCVTNQPDGSMRVQFSLGDALGLPVATKQVQTSKPASPASKAVAAKPSAPMLSTTALAGFFTKHPYDGTAKTYFPRVALTITDWSRNDCWIARAKIWHTARKSESVAPFAVCFNNQSLNFAVNNAAGLQLFMSQMAFEHSGNVRTEGPKSPMLAIPDPQPIDIGRIQQTFQPFIQQLIVETGWKAGAPMNFWIVGYDSNLPKISNAEQANTGQTPQVSGSETQPSMAVNATLTTAIFRKAHSFNGPIQNGCLGLSKEYIGCLNAHGFDGVKWINKNEYRLKLHNGSEISYKHPAKYRRWDADYDGFIEDRFHILGFRTGGDLGSFERICIDAFTGKVVKCPAQ